MVDSRFFASLTMNWVFQEVRRGMNPLLSGALVSLMVGGGWLGITVQNLSTQMASELGLQGPEGALVVMVQQGGPASHAGIIQGDVIVELNGQRVKNTDHLRALLGKSSPGSLMRLKVLREGEQLHLSVRLGERPREAA